MNIAPEVLQYGLQQGLEDHPTGGGCRYLFRDLGGDGPEPWYGPQATIVSRDGDVSPDTLDEPASIVLFLDENWHSCVHTPFASAREAIDALAKMVAINC